MGETFKRKKMIVAITGATGAAIGIHILQALRRLTVETHLIVSNAHDLAAPIASGSYHVDGMIVAPCSVKTLAAINAGICDDLVTRAADVCLKERKRLVLSVRETPPSKTHLRNMLDVSRAGAIIAPLVVWLLHETELH
ncbi:hypothetical protein ACHAQH_002297 [Verticillium albo-atrum]